MSGDIPSDIRIEEIEEEDEEMEEVEEVSETGGGVGAVLAPPRKKMVKKLSSRMLLRKEFL